MCCTTVTKISFEIVSSWKEKNSFVFRIFICMCYIPGCTEEPDHSSRQINQTTLHLKDNAKQQFKKWNVNTKNERKGTCHKRWVTRNLSMKGKNGYLSGKPCFRHFRKKNPSPGCYGTDFESSLTQNDGQTYCIRLKFGRFWFDLIFLTVGKTGQE